MPGWKTEQSYDLPDPCQENYQSQDRSDIFYSILLEGRSPDFGHTPNNQNKELLFFESETPKKEKRKVSEKGKIQATAQGEKWQFSSKQIEDKDCSFSSSPSQQPSQVTAKVKKIKKTKVADGNDGKKKEAKTKNFLINFKGPIANYIQKHYKFNNKTLKQFSQSKSTNLKAYETLFNEQELKPIIAVMFRERYLQRVFQFSRARIRTKIAYLSKIPVFEQAFLKRKFPCIQ